MLLKTGGTSGREQNPGNQDFGKWLKAYGFDDLSSQYRSAAMWLASCPRYGETAWPEGMSDPKNLREWFNEQPKEPLPADLLEVSIETKTVPTVDQKTAEKVAKLVRRAESQDEGSEIAKRHLEAVAKKHEVSVEALSEAAATGAPAAYYQFSPAQVEALEEVRESIMATIPELEQDGLTREAIAAVFINVAHSIMQENNNG